MYSGGDNYRRSAADYYQQFSRGGGPGRGNAATEPPRINTVSSVELSTVVVLKIIKHYEDEKRTSSAEHAQGYLVGLVLKDDSRLEVSNCFPMMKLSDAAPTPGDEDVEEMANHQQDMLKKFRQLNFDYLLVGFYQASPYGACFNETLVESIFDYQSNVEDSIVLIYDPIKTAQGILSLKAYRLSQQALKLCYKDFSPESLKRAGLNYETLFEELPVHIRNSNLSNIALCELALQGKTGSGAKGSFLELSSGGCLEKCLKSLMSDVDGLNADIGKFNRYVNNKQKQEQMKESYIQKRMMENEARKQRGEDPLPLEDEYFLKLNRHVQAPTMLDGLLSAADINAHAEHALAVSAQNLGKLFLAEAIIEDPASGRKERTTSSASVGQ